MKPIALSVANQNSKPSIPSDLKTSPGLSFSFKYFRQIKNFGLDSIQTNWFVSLLERLQAFCSIEKDYLLTPAGRQSLRYHAIDWDSKNIPIKVSDINWVDKKYIGNPDEFPFVQFHVSKALGRVIGFWSETGLVFHVVLLDPMHNMQPSNYNNYKINDCEPLSCQYSSLICDVEDLRNGAYCKTADCKMLSALNKIPTKSNISNMIVISLDDDFVELLNQAADSGKTIKQIFEAGLLEV